MKRKLTWIPVSLALALQACGSDDNHEATPGETGPAPLTVPKVANCSVGDKPEVALQGQVPAAVRSSPGGFQGSNCNLTLVGQFQGEGGDWSSAKFVDTAGHECFYHATAYPTTIAGVPTGRQNPGVPVIDITNPIQPTRTVSLTTPAMMDPWESLRVNARRQILVADNGQNSSFGDSTIDVYDLSGDCRAPQLLASALVGTGADGGVTSPVGPRGHEGNFAPDGLTYYVGDYTNGLYHAIDLTSTVHPKLLATWDIKTLNLGTNAQSTVHGLSVSADGNRAYAVALGRPSLPEVADPNAPLRNGFVVLDTSEVQQRKANAQIKLISSTFFKDGATAQHTIPIRVSGKPYLVMVDEAGSGGSASVVGGREAACSANMAPFPMARIYDMTDETAPKPTSRLMLETHDPKNCAQVLPDVVGVTSFSYGSHYCSVDNRENATALACSYFNSGVRVFDIRNPARPKEIAYYNPPSTVALPGSTHVAFGQWRAGGPDWCASRLDFDFAKKQIVTMCQDNGMLILRFAPNTWPFAESSASFEQN